MFSNSGSRIKFFGTQFYYCYLKIVSALFQLYIRFLDAVDFYDSFTDIVEDFKISTFRRTNQKDL